MPLGTVDQGVDGIRGAGEPRAMTDLHEKAALIALLRRGDRPWHQQAALVEEAGSSAAVLSGEYPGPLEEASPKLFDVADQPSLEDLDAIAAEVRRWEGEGMGVVSVLDDEYPENLRAVFDRPPLLFIRGELIDQDFRSVAIVGTRQASAAGEQRATEIARHMAEAGFTVFSGLATGIDTAAHRGALAAGGRTVGVLGTGLRRSYPASNADLQSEIALRCAVVSQFWPDQPPTRTTFPRRNATMSGLSLATVVVEASHTSGARMQARLALAHGRPVFLLDSLVEQHKWARSYAERPGTHVVSSPDEIGAQIERLAFAEALSF
ncbi:MAG: DNA-processing protein DprA [Mycobacteriales bacterium]